jgi:hypothetical protein
MDYYLLGKLPVIEPPIESTKAIKPNANMAPMLPAANAPEEEHYD